MSINKVTPRTATVIILQGDDDERLRELREEASRLRPTNVDKATDEDLAAYQAKADAADKFAAAAEKRGVKVILRAIGRKTWRDMIARHPARDGEEADKTLGANVETFEEELVATSIGSPVFESDTDRDYFLDSLSVSQFGTLGITAWSLNVGGSADPKALIG